MVSVYADIKTGDGIVLNDGELEIAVLKAEGANITLGFDRCVRDIIMNPALHHIGFRIRIRNFGAPEQEHSNQIEIVTPDPDDRFYLWTPKDVTYLKPYSSHHSPKETTRKILVA